MKIKLFASTESLSEQAAEDIFTLLATSERRNFAPTGGSSPLALYRHLISRLAQENAGQKVHYYLQDEIPDPADASQPGVIYQHIDRHLFTPAAIPPQRIHPLNASSVDNADRAIAADGGLDLLLLGVGLDGHIAANLPGTAFDTLTRTIPIDRSNPALMAALSKEVGGAERVPASYFSFGIRTILNARQIILLATGENKAQIVRDLLLAPASEALPASALQQHQDCTLYLDRAAARLLDEDWLQQNASIQR